jgi:hypothetical protein
VAKTFPSFFDVLRRLTDGVRASTT